ncbi:hypothetical protein J3R82DRAFT_4005 [Butyriboletus roseoflavus]|nr:hypothetical protein J3R82DRAFT_4005 [Butyriboletus roseoflavus]
MSFTPHDIGTLIVVVLKAKNLPNKRHIGKQAPYCLVTLNEEKRRTKVIKRGGQHPEWDDEFRFTILEDADAGLVRSAPGSATPPPLPPKKRGPKRIKGGSFMRLQCYADDARDPDFIGETLVDLTEVLTKGETDEWFVLMNKDKYAGEVYVELTFWSNEPPPEKKSSRKPTILNKNYGGPGSFVPADGSASLNGNTHSTAWPMPASADGQLNSLPSSLRVSGSRPELYAPPYEQRNVTSPVEQIANDFAELGVVDHRSRDSCAVSKLSLLAYVPSDTLSESLNQTLRPSISTGFHPLPLPSSQSHEQRGQIEESSFAYDNAITPTTSRLSFSPSYYPTYENGSVPSPPPPVRNNGPRYSMPTSSSGFVAIPSIPPSSSYASVSYSPEPPTFSVAQGHPSHSPSSNPPLHAGYSTHHTHPGYTTVPPTPSLTAPAPPPPPSSVVYHRISHSLSASQVPDYHSYQQTSLGHEQTAPFPTQSVEYGNPLPPPTPVHSTPPQMYTARTPTTPSPPSEVPSLAAPSYFTTGSRPLPQPGQFQRDRRYSVAVPPSSSFPQQVGTAFLKSGSALPGLPHYRRIPTAPGYPPLPESMSSRPPPLPVPPPQVQGNPPRPPAMPQPPLGYHPAPPAYQPLPPPLTDMSQRTQLPPSASSSFGNTLHFQGLAQRPPQPYPNYGQPLPTPPHGDWQ